MTMTSVTESITLEGRQYDTHYGVILATRIMIEAGELVVKLLCEFRNVGTQEYPIIDGVRVVPESFNGNELLSLLTITGAEFWEDLVSKPLIGLFYPSGEDGRVVGICSTDGQLIHFPGRGTLQPDTYMATRRSPEVGENIITTRLLGRTAGMLIATERLAARRTGLAGKIGGVVGGHGGDVWFVEHTDGTHAAYTVAEMIPTQP